MCIRDSPWAFALFGFGYLSTLSLDAFGGGHGHGASPEGGSPKYESVPSLEGGAAARSKAAARSAAAATASATTALAVHSLGDGAAIGVQVHARACAVVGLAIVVHKFFGALALGAILSRDGPLLKAPAAIFAVATPLALLASWAGAREGLFGGVFADRVTALCAGTLLHVAAAGGMVDAAKLLLEGGAPVDVILCCDCVYVPLYGDCWIQLLEAIDALAGPTSDVLIAVERRHVRDGDDGVDAFLAGMAANGFAASELATAAPVVLLHFTWRAT